ncbi:MAG TPA: tetraacyldisaccharide 4'-kinase [Thermoanaerobaculia bacterium]|nr:tetraacyldisaccharide 4'-kinase [Thermoanaerobaculia bacterium]
MIDLLFPAEAAYRGINRVRRGLYRRGVLRSETLPRPVISVGNRAIGGSGKTPAVIAIARALIAAGVRVAILTRGYGRTETSEPLLVDRADAERYGDEPSVIHEEVPGVAVIVGGRRARAARWFLERADCDVFLLDDGFQHIQLARDVDIVIENAAARRFREGASALADADVVLLRNGARVMGPAPAFEAVLEPADWIDANGPRPLGELRGKRAIAFAGLADNGQFFRMITALGVELREAVSFRDHQRYGDEELRRIEDARRANAAELVLTTTKDRVKTAARDYAALRVEMAIDPALFALLLARIGRR